MENIKHWITRVLGGTKNTCIIKDESILNIINNIFNMQNTTVIREKSTEVIRGL